MRKRGFTLTELLAVIVVLGIIMGLGIVAYIKYIDIVNEKSIKIEKENLLSSVASYYEEYQNTANYLKQQIVQDGKNITYSCVTIKSLIDHGYFKRNKTFKDKTLSDDTIIKITSVNGVKSYEIINDYDKDEVCTYYDIGKTASNGEGNEVTVMVDVEDIDNPGYITFKSGVHQ